MSEHPNNSAGFKNRWLQCSQQTDVQRGVCGCALSFVVVVALRHFSLHFDMSGLCCSACAAV